jgi:hypothetical protein
MQGGMSSIPPCIPGSHPHRVTNNKCRIDTVISPDDGHIIIRNMYRKEINILKKLYAMVALFTRLLYHLHLEDIAEDGMLLLKEMIKNRMGGHKLGCSASG